MSNWENLKVGTPVCNMEWDFWCNYKVEAIGHDWAVLRNIETGELSRDILEPSDDFVIGTLELTENGFYTLDKED